LQEQLEKHLKSPTINNSNNHEQNDVVQKCRKLENQITEINTEFEQTLQNHANELQTQQIKYEKIIESERHNHDQQELKLFQKLITVQQKLDELTQKQQSMASSSSSMVTSPTIYSNISSLNDLYIESKTSKDTNNNTNLTLKTGANHLKDYEQKYVNNVVNQSNSTK